MPGRRLTKPQRQARRLSWLLERTKTHDPQEKIARAADYARAITEDLDHRTAKSLADDLARKLIDLSNRARRLSRPAGKEPQ